MERFMKKTPDGDWFSAAVPSDGNAYDIPPGLIFSFPVRSLGNGNYEIVKNLKISDYTRKKIGETTKELLDERQVVKDLLSK
jgi:malate/lactate dehydrogenase